MAEPSSMSKDPRESHSSRQWDPGIQPISDTNNNTINPQQTNHSSPIRTTHTPTPSNNITRSKTQRRRERRQHKKNDRSKIRTNTKKPYKKDPILREIRPDNEEFGDRISRTKANNVVRILLHNINELPLHANPTLQETQGSGVNKNHSLCKEITDKHADIALIQEPGVNFSQLPPEDQWSERAYSKLPAHKATWAYNTTKVCTNRNVK